MKTSIKYITGIISILLLCIFSIATTDAAIFNFGRQSAGTHIWTMEGENTVTACNNINTCGTGTFRIDRGAPVIETTWTREEVSYNTLMQISATDGVSMLGGSLLVTQDSDKFNIGTPIVSGKQATVSITLKPDYITDIFETTFNVTAYDHLLKTSNQTFKVIYDGVEPVIDVTENNTGDAEAQFFLKAFAAEAVTEKMRVAGLDEDADITDNYGFLIKFIENDTAQFSVSQTGIDEILYRYTVDPNFYPTELIDGIEESRINNLGLTTEQANALWYKQLSTDTDLKFSSQYRRELIEQMNDEGLTSNQQDTVLALWDEIWKSEFYQVPSVESKLQWAHVNKDAELDTYLKIQESGRVLIEVRVVDAAGNVTSEIFNIHLDTKPLVKVYPLEWINVDNGEVITIELVNKHDNNKWYSQDTYNYFIRSYNTDGSVNSNILHQGSITDGQAIIDQAAIGSLNLKGKHQLEVVYSNPNSEYTSDSFITNIYLDSTPVVQAADIVTNGEYSTEFSECATTNPDCNPSQVVSKTEVVEQADGSTKSAQFVNYSPDFSITAQNDGGGRSDVISFSLRKVADSGGTMAEEETQVFVFDTNGKQTIEFLDEDEVEILVTEKGVETASDDDNKDKLTRVVKNSVAEKVNNIYQSELIDEVAKVLKVNELNGASTLTSAIDTTEAQRKSIVTSVDDGLGAIEDEKGVREVLTTEVPTISFFKNTAEKKYQNTLTQLSNLINTTKEQELIIDEQSTEIEKINILVNEKYSIHADLYGQISDLSNQLRPKVNEINLLKADYSNIHTQLLPYTYIERDYGYKKDELSRLIIGHSQRLTSLDNSYKNAPYLIQSYQSQIRSLQEQLNNVWCFWSWWGCSRESEIRAKISYYNSEISRLENIRQTYISKRANLISTYNSNKAIIEAKIHQMEADLVVKKGLKDNLAVLTDQIAKKNAEIKHIEEEITAIDWELSKKANSEDIIASTVRKQKLLKQNRILESFLIRNEKLILNTERNLYLLAEEAGLETTTVQNDITATKDAAVDTATEEAENKDTTTESDTVSLINIVNTVLGIQSANAAPLDEGVYVLPDESLLIVDYTPPTGEISGLQSKGGNAEETDGTLFKPWSTALELGASKFDNFQDYGSFKSWTVTGIKGTHDTSEAANCILGATTQVIATGVDYGQEVVTDGDALNPTDSSQWFMQDNWGECVQYELYAEDHSGNNDTFFSEFFYADGIAPAFVTEPTVSVATETAAYQDCPTCDIESAWSNTPITVNWDIRDDQSGFRTATLNVVYNGVDQGTIDLMQNYDLVADEDGSTTLEDTTTNTIEDSDQHIFGSYTHPLTDGYYELTLTFTDKSGNITQRTIVLKYDTTSPVVDMNMNSTDGTNDEQLAGISTWEFDFDDENGMGATQVARVVKEDTTVSFQKCDTADCSISTELTRITGNTVAPENTDWVDALTAFTWNDWTSKQTISNKNIEIKHSAYYNDGTGAWDPTIGGGQYKIVLSVQDRAGNVTPMEKIITVEPNQRDTANTVFTPEVKCNDGSWQANGTDLCNLTLNGRDVYDNPLYGKSVYIQGWSDTPLDWLHYSHADDDSGNQESIFFEGTVSAQGIRNDKEYVLDNNGDIVVPFISMSPEGTTKQLDFTLKFTPHTAVNYPNNTAILSDYTLTDAENNKDYQSDIAFNFNWNSIPLFFQKNATQTISFNTTENSVNSVDERIGLYIYTKTDGYYALNVMEPTDTIEDQDGSIGPVEVDPWARAVNSNIQTSLGVDAADYNNDHGVVYSNEDTDLSHIFKLQFTKLPGAQESDTNVSIAPFARMTIAGKEIAYGLMDKALDDDTASMIPLYNQSTQALGSGMMQSNTGNAAQNDGSESTDSSSSSLSLNVIASEVKDNVKREIIDIAPAGAAGTVSAGADVNGLQVGGDARLINNSHTYVARDQDLVINGDIEIADTPLSFVSYGGNVVIRGNITYAVGSKKPTIALIALQNEETKVGGEIHIANTTSVGDPLTDLVGTFISERGTLGLSSADETNLTETERQAELTHQLVINGSIIGGNTLGGGDDPYACPAFIRQSLCDIITLGAKSDVNIPQKYDLNYLRRFVPIQDVNDLDGDTDIFEDHPNYQRSPNNQGSTEPVIVDYYVNKTLLPEELQ